jgi:hypothetical protein
VLADAALNFLPPAPATPAEVAVRGWPQLAGNARKEFIQNVSDHASLFARVA